MNNVIKVDFTHKSIYKLRPAVDTILKDYGFDTDHDRIPQAAIDCAVDEASFELGLAIDPERKVVAKLATFYNVIPYSI